MLILSVGPLKVVSSKALMLFPLGGGTDSKRVSDLLEVNNWYLNLEVSLQSPM